MKNNTDVVIRSIIKQLRKAFNLFTTSTALMPVTDHFYAFQLKFNKLDKFTI